MIEYRVKNSLTEDQLKPMWGKVLTDDERSLTVSGPIRVQKPDGSPLLVCVPGAIPSSIREDTYPILHKLRELETTNRGLASGMKRFERYKGSKRTETAPISSAVVGAFDPIGPWQYCRLTAWTGREVEQFAGLVPLFSAIASTFQKYVPERFAVQAREAQLTKAEWRIADTPFTTITVNNTFPTGVHIDKGDLGEGFSCLTVLRRGGYSGGVLTFPKYRLGVDMQDGDVLLMDAHEAHGNTHLYCGGSHGPPTRMRGMCEQHGTERISVVCYFRTKMKACGTLEEEGQKRIAAAERGMSEGDENTAMLEAAVSKGYAGA